MTFQFIYLPTSESFPASGWDPNGRHGQAADEKGRSAGGKLRSGEAGSDDADEKDGGDGEQRAPATLPSILNELELTNKKGSSGPSELCSRYTFDKEGGRKDGGGANDRTAAAILSILDKVDLLNGKHHLLVSDIRALEHDVTGIKKELLMLRGKNKEDPSAGLGSEEQEDPGLELKEEKPSTSNGCRSALDPPEETIDWPTLDNRGVLPKEDDMDDLLLLAVHQMSGGGCDASMLLLAVEPIWEWEWPKDTDDKEEDRGEDKPNKDDTEGEGEDKILEYKDKDKSMDEEMPKDDKDKSLVDLVDDTLLGKKGRSDKIEGKDKKEEELRAMTAKGKFGITLQGGQLLKAFERDEEEDIPASGEALGAASKKRSKRAEKRKRYRENKRAKREAEVAISDNNNKKNSPRGSVGPECGPQHHGPVNLGGMSAALSLAQLQSITVTVGRALTNMTQCHGLVGFGRLPEGTSQYDGPVRAGRTHMRGAQRHAPLAEVGSWRKNIQNKSSPGGAAAPEGRPQRPDPINVGRVPTAVAQFQSMIATFGTALTSMARCQWHGLVDFGGSGEDTAPCNVPVGVGRTPRGEVGRHVPVGRTKVMARRAGWPRGIGRRDKSSSTSKKLMRISRLVAAAALLLPFSGLKCWLQRQGTMIVGTAIAANVLDHQKSSHLGPMADTSPFYVVDWPTQSCVSKVASELQSSDMPSATVEECCQVFGNDLLWNYGVDDCISQSLSQFPKKITTSSPSEKNVQSPTVLQTAHDNGASLQTGLPSTVPMSEMTKMPPFVSSVAPTASLVSSTAPTALNMPHGHSSDIGLDSAVEREALQTIYNVTGGVHWFNRAGWMTKLRHCDWHGISCDSDGHVTLIDLRNNNVTGEFPSDALSKLYNLKEMDLANNGLWGTMDGTTHSGATSTDIFFNLRDLYNVDLSENYLSGEADVLFAPALVNVNFSHNNFTSVDTFKTFKPSLKTLRVFDLSYNAIKQNISDLMNNAPPNIERFIFSNNLVEGGLLPSLENLPSLKQFNIASNCLSGGIPDLSTAFPNLHELDLSNQRCGNAKGLNGTIPESLLNLRFLTSLNLGGNLLSGSILPVLGSFAQLEVLDLSDNNLKSTIPVQLAKLGSDLQILNLSMNELYGLIPSELSSLQGAAISLGGNSKLLNPAPLKLCFSSKFDLGPMSEMCPRERNALTELYDSANGGEWAVKSFWADSYTTYCAWSGITCNEQGHTVKLELSGNGLSGTLSKRVGDLPFLEVLDLAHNEIKGTIPSEIGRLFNVERLRLNHNSFDKNMPDLGNLTQLELIRLDGNRLSGSIPPTYVQFAGDFSYISDCGIPSEHAEEFALHCEECTMCCNADGSCHPTKETLVQKGNFKNYHQFGVSFLAMLLLACFAFASAVFLYDKMNKSSQSLQSSVGGPSMTERDAEYALEFIGKDSVYQFILGASRVGLAIALATVAIQLWMLFVFVEATDLPFELKNNEFPYYWKCTPDQDVCTSTSDLDIRGWMIFGFSMGAHLSADAITGTHLIILSGRERHGTTQRIRLFIGGLIKTSMALFTLLISAIFNAVTAKSNTEIIMNCVAIIFVLDIDEYMYEILCAINGDWGGGVSVRENESFAETPGNYEMDEDEDKIVQRLNEEIKTLKEKLNQLIDHFPQVEKIKTSPYNGHAITTFQNRNEYN